MEELQFDEEPTYQPRPEVQKKSLLTQLVLATGVVSSDQQAQYVLLSIAAVATVLSFFLFFSTSGTPPPQVPPGMQVVDTPGWPPRLVQNSAR
ncbi:MAG: hypothetical protein ACYCZZ_00040 [Minisyncoccota bacterium]